MRKQWPCTHQGLAQDHTQTHVAEARSLGNVLSTGNLGAKLCGEVTTGSAMPPSGWWPMISALPRVEGDRGWEGEGRWHLLFSPQTLFLTLVESVVSTSHSSPQRGYSEARAALKLPPFFRFHKRYDSWRATWVFLGWGVAGRVVKGDRSRSFSMESLYSGNFSVLEISSTGRVQGGKFGTVRSLDSSTHVFWDQSVPPR